MLFEETEKSTIILEEFNNLFLKNKTQQGYRRTEKYNQPTEFN